MFRRLLFLLLIPLVTACNLANNQVETPIPPTPTSIAEFVTNTAAASVRETPTATPPSSDTPRPTNTVQPTSVSCTPRADWTTTYTVVTGDTLSSIAGRANTTTRELADANCLTNVNVITVGQRLRVPRVLVVWTPTFTPTSTATNTPTGPAITSFSASPNPANFNSTVILTWQTRGAGGVRIRFTNRQPVQTSTTSTLTANGSTTFSLNEPAIQNGAIVITLVLTDATGTLLVNSSGGNYTQDLTITLNPYPRVLTFTSNPTTVTAGGTATLSWTTQNATSAVLSRLDAAGRIAEQIGSYSANGSATVTIPTGITSVTYHLFLTDANAINNSATLTLTVNPAACSFTSYIAETCPTTQATNIASAHQTFQSGRMVWRSDSRTIYVLYSNGTAQTFSDTYNGETITPQTPPDAALRQPMNGFGWLWQNNSTVRGAIGWATDAETGYNSTYETTSNNRTYFTFPNNTIVRVDTSANTWTTITR
jgi:LysM repeat protein